MYMYVVKKAGRPKVVDSLWPGKSTFTAGCWGVITLSWTSLKARDRETLPVVLTVNELQRLFKQIPLLRYRIPLLLIYASRLRVRECIALIGL